MSRGAPKTSKAAVKPDLCGAALMKLLLMRCKRMGKCFFPVWKFQGRFPAQWPIRSWKRNKAPEADAAVHYFRFEGTFTASAGRPAPQSTGNSQIQKNAVKHVSVIPLKPTSIRTNKSKRDTLVENQTHNFPLKPTLIQPSYLDVDDVKLWK